MLAHVLLYLVELDVALVDLFVHQFVHIVVCVFVIDYVQLVQPLVLQDRNISLTNRAS